MEWVPDPDESIAYYQHRRPWLLDPHGKLQVGHPGSSYGHLKQEGTPLAWGEVYKGVAKQHSTGQSYEDYVQKLYDEEFREPDQEGGHVREAEWTPEKAEEANGYKWVWNPDQGVLVWKTDTFGLPVHNVAIQRHWGRGPEPYDYRGYGIVNGDKIELDGPFGVPPQAYADAKAEIARQEPNAQIVMPDQNDRDLGVEFVEAPTRQAAAIWAQRHLGSDWQKSDSPERLPEPSE